MLLNLREIAKARAGTDSVTTQAASIVVPLRSRQITQGESGPLWGTFDLMSGRLTSIQITFDLDQSRVAPFESIEPKCMSGRFVGN